MAGGSSSYLDLISVILAPMLLMNLKVTEILNVAYIAPEDYFKDSNITYKHIHKTPNVEPTLTIRKVLKNVRNVGSFGPQNRFYGDSALRIPASHM